jgi:hypothetical protein
MKKFVQWVVFTLTVLVNGVAFAGTQVLGFEIGISTVDQVRSTLAKQTKIKGEDVNKWTGGPQFITDGSPFEIRGLKNVQYIFDEQKKLTAIIMTMGKDSFDSVYKAVSAKYKVVSQERPFVGNQYAKLKSQDSIIEIDAPHMGFEMEVRYIRDDLIKKFNEQSSAEEQAKKKKEASKF